MSLSFSDVSERKLNNNKQSKQNGDRKTNRLGDLLGASNVRAPEGRGIPNYNPVQQHSANLNVFQQQNNNILVDAKADNNRDIVHWSRSLWDLDLRLVDMGLCPLG